MRRRRTAEEVGNANGATHFLRVREWEGREWGHPLSQCSQSNCGWPHSLPIRSTIRSIGAPYECERGSSTAMPSAVASSLRA